MAGENLNLNVIWDYMFENIIIIGKDNNIIYKPSQNIITFCPKYQPKTDTRIR